MEIMSAPSLKVCKKNSSNNFARKKIGKQNLQANRFYGNLSKMSTDGNKNMNFCVV